MRHVTLIVLFTLLAGSALHAQPTSELDFLTGLTEHRELRDMLPKFLKGRAFELLEQRSRTVAGLRTMKQVEERRAYIRKEMLEALGGLPERTPLNARVTGTLDRGDYRIEKIIFESLPNFYVTANLYVPTRGTPPFPGILFPLGHEGGAKAHEAWQRVLGSLAKKGFVGLAWDPVGQGERVQLWDADFGAAKLVRSTTEHSMYGIQCLLTGDNLARYTIWDGIRALDYLLSRPEVDPKRIGLTGNSGGGTHTAYLAALDDRIHVAAPSCYITNWARLLTSIGPQDAEQNLPPWLHSGLDHGDFLLAFAPKPYLLLAAVRDFFSITGVRETHAEVRRVYESLGAAEKIGLVEADDGHGYTLPRRLAAYDWFSRWLKGSGDTGPEPEIEIATEEELFVTESGQVVTSLGGETVYTLNRKRAEMFASKRPQLSADVIRRVIAFNPPGMPVNAASYGVLERSGYRIEKWLYSSEPGIGIPAVVYAPSTPGRKPAVLLVSGRGKAAESSGCEALVKAGFVVMAADLRGLGETRVAGPSASSDWPQYFGDYASSMTGLLIGRPLTGMRAQDIARSLDLLTKRDDVDAARIYGIGRESAGIPLLHAAALDPRLKRVLLDGMLVSYEAVVRATIHRQVFENAPRGVLRSYDLPQLTAMVAPRPVWLVDTVDPLGRRISVEEAARHHGALSDTLRLVRRRPGEAIQNVFLEMAGKP